MVELSEGDSERAYLSEAASVHGLDADALRITRLQLSTPAGPVSALSYGMDERTDPPALALLHGGGQNAHTWDLTMAALGLPAVAVDLPGHGSSHWLPDHDYSPRRLTGSVTEALQTLCPDVEVLVGMSLGGMVALTVADSLPRLRRLVLVDVSPGSVLPPGNSVREIRRQPAASFDTLVERIAEASPRRPRGGLRHAVWHSTRPVEGGRIWRTDPRLRVGSFADLWPELLALAPRVTEILASHGSFVPEDDRTRLEELLSDRVLRIDGATHSVQNTRPRELASVLRRVAGK